MKFRHQNNEWTVISAPESPYVKTIDCRLPKASADKLANELLAIEPTKIELLGMRAYRDHVSRQHHVWGFRLTAGNDSQIIEIAHQADQTVRNRRRG